MIYTSGAAAYTAGDYETAATLADQMLELAEREGNPTNLGPAYVLQVDVRFVRGDLAGAKEHFTCGLRFFEDAAIWPISVAVWKLLELRAGTRWRRASRLGA